MEKINFENFKSPGLSKEILMQLQDNIEEAIKTVENKTLYTEILTGSITVGGNQVSVFRPNYSSISGEIIASILIGGVSTSANQEILELIPNIAGTNKTDNKVSSVVVKSSSAATIYINILVFYKK